MNVFDHQAESAKPKARKSFSPEIKETAMAMLNNGSTLKQTAEHIGCSVAALQQWKAKTAKKAGRKPGRKSKKVKKAQTQQRITAVVSAKSEALCEHFIREYWCQENRGADMLASPPLSGFNIFFRVNEALKYAYEYFNK